MLKTEDIKKAKPREKQYKLAHGKGLTLIVKPNGTKLWQFRYRIDGREKTLSIGQWPEIDLKSAELARDEARNQDSSRRHRSQRGKAGGKEFPV
ncbi:MAG: Arm DNA-binding domain-containing protein [Pseudomonadota bacterium]